MKFASANENPATKDLAVDLATTFGREPFDTPIGPVKPRGALSGIIIKNGYIIGEWGETARVDMTFSVTKSFLSTVVGLMVQKGLIRDVTDPVKDYMPPGDAAALFESPHNSKITWEHLLRQTSDWRGSESGGSPTGPIGPRGRRLRVAGSQAGARHPLQFQTDARVNVLALAALHVLRRPLPEYLREEIMEPIGASVRGAGMATRTRGSTSTDGGCSR